MALDLTSQPRKPSSVFSAVDGYLQHRPTSAERLELDSRILAHDREFSVVERVDRSVLIELSFLIIELSFLIERSVRRARPRRWAPIAEAVVAKAGADTSPDSAPSGEDEDGDRANANAAEDADAAADEATSTATRRMNDARRRKTRKRSSATTEDGKKRRARRWS